ncbi:MAG TPA: alpha/beta hydrolase-fold protein [Bryobacteraceae bacterium]
MFSAWKTGRWCAGFLLCAATLAAQVYPPGPQVLTFFSDVDDSDQPYALYLPRNFETSKKYPLVISLHGAWSNHRLNLRRVFGRGNLPGETDTEATRRFPPLREVDYIVASPYARGSMGYQGIAEKDVLDVLADVKRRFPIDEDRVYLTGLSMGGGGTLWLGLTHPDTWAAIAAVCPAAPPGAEALAPNALNLPVHLFHGDQDNAVPVDVSRTWNKNLANLGTGVEYIEYPGVRHNSWDLAYKDGAIFDWFAGHKRNRFPARVRFVSQAYRYSSAYWVRLDGLTPGTLASIDARFTGRNRIEATTANLDGFTLKLEGHPSFSRRRPLVVAIDGDKLPVKPLETLSFVKVSGAWKAGRYTPPEGAKRAGLEGPIGDAVAARHVYVYGTKGASGEEEAERRREVAAHAAEWSTPQLKLLLTLPVSPDVEVSAAEIATSNLILFGTSETNHLIERYAANLPLELNPGAADYGLVFIAPVAGRYVVVNSGLPFWTGKETAKRPGLEFIDSLYKLLGGFGDFILFKGSLENVIAEGRFDRRWKLPPEDAAKIRATGAVNIR